MNPSPQSIRELHKGREQEYADLLLGAFSDIVEALIRRKPHDHYRSDMHLELLLSTTLRTIETSFRQLRKHESAYDKMSELTEEQIDLEIARLDKAFARHSK